VVRVGSEDAAPARVAVVGDVELVDDVVGERGALGDDGELGHQQRVVVVL